MELRVPLDKKLRDFQIENIKQGLKFLTGTNKKYGVKTRGWYNADDMGLGKTLQTIVALNTLDCQKNLIICPAVAVPVWEDALREWSLLANRTVNIIRNPKDASHANLSNFSIVSYNLAIKESIRDCLKIPVYDALILDEAHRCKNYKTQTTRTCLGLFWPQAKYHFALSGTPAKKNIVDLYTLAHKFAPTVPPFDDYFKFAAKFSHKENNGFADVYFGIRNPKTLSRMIRSLFLTRRTKTEVLKELPPKEFSKIPLGKKFAVIEMPNTPEELVRREAEAVVEAIENDTEVPVVTNLAQLRKLQGVAKIPAMVEFIKEFLEQDIPLVVFCWHKAIIQGLIDAFPDAKPAVVWGKSSPKQKKLEPKRFQDGKTNLFIGQLQSAGIAITLTRATHCLMGELDWSPDNVAQAVDRLHRIGQTGNVMVYYMCVKDSVDELVADAVVTKLKEFKKVFDRGGKGGKKK